MAKGQEQELAGLVPAEKVEPVALTAEMVQAAVLELQREMEKVQVQEQGLVQALALELEEALAAVLALVQPEAEQGQE